MLYNSFQSSKVVENASPFILAKFVCWCDYGMFLSMLLGKFCSSSHARCCRNVGWSNWVFYFCIVTYSKQNTFSCPIIRVMPNKLSRVLWW